MTDGGRGIGAKPELGSGSKLETIHYWERIRYEA